MQVEVEKQETNSVKLTFAIEAERVEVAFSKAFKKLAKSVSVPGFRPGKAPRSVLEKKIGKETIAHEVLEYLIPDAYITALKEKSIEPIDLPKIEKTSLPEPGQAFSFCAVVEVKPEVKLGPYKGLLLEKEMRKVTPKEEEEALHSLRERKAILAPTDDAIQEGHVVEISIQGYKKGEKLADFKGEIEEEVGKGNLLPDIEKALIGMKVGEKKRVLTTLSETFAMKKYRGEELEIEVIVKECKSKSLPEVNDLFAQSVGTESVEELKAKLRENLDLELAHQERDKAISILIRKAANQAEGAVPEVMVKRETEELIQKMDTNLRYYGLAVEDYIENGKLKSDDKQKEVEKEAREKVRIDLVLEAIAKEEGCSVSSEELQKEIEHIAARIRREPAYVKEKLEENGRIKEIEKQLLRYKAMQFILDHAEVKMVEAQQKNGGRS